MIDHQTLDDETVTIRDRDTMLQERVHIKRIEEIITKNSMSELLK